MKQTIRVTINGRLFEEDVEPRLLLSHFLYRAELTVFCQTLDCGYFAAICLDSKVETGFRQLVVQKNRAGAAFTDNAADVGPGETDILPQEMRQEQAGFDIFFEKSPIDSNANCLFHNQVK